MANAVTTNPWDEAPPPQPQFAPAPATVSSDPWDEPAANGGPSTGGALKDHVEANIKQWVPKSANNFNEAIAAGWGMSDSGLVVAGKLPDFVIDKHTPFLYSIAGSITQTAGDIPGMVAGAIAGAPISGVASAGGAAIGGGAASLAGPEATPAGAAIGGVIGAGAAEGYMMNMVPEAVRQHLVASYRSGEHAFSGDFVSRGMAAIWDAQQAGLVGAATLGAGKGVAGQSVKLGQKVLGITGSRLAGGAAKTVAQGSAELAAMSTTSAALSGHMPDAGDFARNAVTIMGMHAIGGAVGSEGVRSASKRMEDIYMKTGLTPDEQRAAAEHDPALREEILGKMPDEPVGDAAMRYARPDPEPHNTETPGSLNATTIETGEEIARKAISQPETPTERDVRFMQEWAQTPRKQQLIATRKLSTGEILYGKPGEVHSDLLQPGERDVTDKIDAQMGFAEGPGKPHMTREEAFKWVEKNQPEMTGRQYKEKALEANQYQENLAAGGSGGKPPATGSTALTERPEPKPDGGWTFKMNPDMAHEVMRDFIGEPVKEKKTILDHIGDAYTRYMDSLHPAAKIDKAMEVDTKREYGIEDGFRQAYGGGMRASYFIRQGTIDPITMAETSKDSLVAGYKSAMANGGNYEEFQNYRIAQRALEKEAQGITSGLTPIQLEAARILTSDKGQKSKYAEGAAIIQRNNDATVDYVRDSGVYSAKSAEAMKEMNRDYIPFNRIVGDESFSGVGSNGFRVRNPAKRMEGSERKITEPTEAEVANKYLQVTMADRNRAVGQIVGAVERKNNDTTATIEVNGKQVTFDPINVKMIGKFDPNAHAEDIKDELAAQGLKPADVAPFIAERAWSKGKLGDNTFVYYRNGVPELWKSDDPWLAKMIRGADPQDMGMLTKVARGFAATSRSMSTGVPTFALMRAMRDEAQIATQSPYNYRPFIDWSIGTWHAFKAGEVYQEWWRNGGAGSTLQEMDRDMQARDIQKLFEKTGVWGAVRNVVTNPAAATNWFDQKLDTGMRIGHYLRAKSMGLSPLKAASESVKYPVDYRTKSLSAGMNKLMTTIPFARTHINAITQMFEDVGRDPAGLLMRGTAYITAPSIALWMANYWQDEAHKDDPNYQRYSDIPRWERDAYFITPQVGGVRLRLQKPIGPLGLVLGALPQRFLDYYVEHDPRAFKDWAQTFAGEFIPNVIPTIIEPIVEGLTGKNLYTLHDLTPASLEKQSPELRYTPYTSEVAKKAANLLNQVGIPATPIMLDRTVQDWLGGTGEALMHMFDKTVPERPPEDLSSNPFIHAFVIRNPQMDATPISDFYDEAKEFGFARADMRAGELQSNSEIMKKAGMSPTIQFKVTGISRVLSNQRQLIERINYDKSMSDTDKRQTTEKLYSLMRAEAKQGVIIMDQIRHGH